MPNYDKAAERIAFDNYTRDLGIYRTPVMFDKVDSKWDVDKSIYDTPEENIAKRQDGWSQAGNFLNQGVVGEIIGGTIENVGSLFTLGALNRPEGSLFTPASDDIKFLTDKADTPAAWVAKMNNVGNIVSGIFGKWMQEAGRGVRDWTKDVTPIYEEKPGAVNPGDGAWWWTNAVSLGSTIGLMLPALGVGKLVGGLGKFGAAVSQVGVEASALKKIVGSVKNILPALGEDLIATAVSRNAEGMMEGSQVYTESYDKYFKEFKSKGLTDKEAHSKATLYASRAAAYDYRLNWVMSLQDFAQFRALRGIGTGFFGKDITGTYGQEALAKQKGLTSRILPAILKRPKETLSTFGSEAFEESYQFIISEEAKRHGDILAGLDYDKRSLVDRVADDMSKDEFWNSFIWGGLGGILFQSIGGPIRNIHGRTKQAIQTGRETSQEGGDVSKVIKDSFNAAKGFKDENQQKLDNLQRGFTSIDKLVAGVKDVTNPESKDHYFDQIKMAVGVNYAEGDDAHRRILDEYLQKSVDSKEILQGDADDVKQIAKEYSVLSNQKGQYLGFKQARNNFLISKYSAKYSGTDAEISTMLSNLFNIYRFKDTAKSDEYIRLIQQEESNKHAIDLINVMLENSENQKNKDEYAKILKDRNKTLSEITKRKEELEDDKSWVGKTEDINKIKNANLDELHKKFLLRDQYGLIVDKSILENNALSSKIIDTKASRDEQKRQISLWIKKELDGKLRRDPDNIHNTLNKIEKGYEVIASKEDEDFLNTIKNYKKDLENTESSNFESNAVSFGNVNPIIKEDNKYKFSDDLFTHLFNGAQTKASQYGKLVERIIKDSIQSYTGVVNPEFKQSITDKINNIFKGNEKYIDKAEKAIRELINLANNETNVENQMFLDNVILSLQDNYTETIASKSFVVPTDADVNKSTQENQQKEIKQITFYSGNPAWTGIPQYDIKYERNKAGDLYGYFTNTPSVQYGHADDAFVWDDLNNTDLLDNIKKLNLEVRLDAIDKDKIDLFYDKSEVLTALKRSDNDFINNFHVLLVVYKGDKRHVVGYLPAVENKTTGIEDKYLKDYNDLISLRKNIYDQAKKSDKKDGIVSIVNSKGEKYALTISDIGTRIDYKRRNDGALDFSTPQLLDTIIKDNKRQSNWKFVIFDNGHIGVTLKVPSGAEVNARGTFTCTLAKSQELLSAGNRVNTDIKDTINKLVTDFANANKDNTEKEIKKSLIQLNRKLFTFSSLQFDLDIDKLTKGYGVFLIPFKYTKDKNGVKIKYSSKASLATSGPQMHKDFTDFNRSGDIIYLNVNRNFIDRQDNNITWDMVNNDPTLEKYVNKDTYRNVILKQGRVATIIQPSILHSTGMEVYGYDDGVIDTEKKPTQQITTEPTTATVFNSKDKPGANAVKKLPRRKNLPPVEPKEYISTTESKRWSRRDVQRAAIELDKIIPTLHNKVTEFVKTNNRTPSPEEMAILKKQSIPVYISSYLMEIADSGGKKAEGLFKNAAIYLFKNATVGTHWHEAFHAVFALMLNQNQQNAIWNEAVKIAVKDGKSLSIDNKREINEYLADKFMNYKLGRESVKSIGEKIYNFFSDLWSMITNIFIGDTVSIDRLFERIDTGYYKNKPILTDITLFQEEARSREDITNAKVVNNLVKQKILLLLDTDERYNGLTVMDVINGEGIDELYYDVACDLLDRAEVSSNKLKDKNLSEQEIKDLKTNIEYINSISRGEFGIILTDKENEPIFSNDNKILFGELGKTALESLSDLRLNIKFKHIKIKDLNKTVYQLASTEEDTSDSIEDDADDYDTYDKYDNEQSYYAYLNTASEKPISDKASSYLRIKMSLYPDMREGKQIKLYDVKQYMEWEDVHKNLLSILCNKTETEIISELERLSTTVPYIKNVYDDVINDTKFRSDFMQVYRNIHMKKIVNKKFHPVYVKEKVYDNSPVTFVLKSGIAENSIIKDIASSVIDSAAIGNGIYQYDKGEIKLKTLSELESLFKTILVNTPIPNNKNVDVVVKNINDFFTIIGIDPYTINNTNIEQLKNKYNESVYTDINELQSLCVQLKSGILSTATDILNKKEDVNENIFEDTKFIAQDGIINKIAKVLTPVLNHKYETSIHTLNGKNQYNYVATRHAYEMIRELKRGGLASEMRKDGLLTKDNFILEQDLKDLDIAYLEGYINDNTGTRHSLENITKASFESAKIGSFINVKNGRSWFAMPPLSDSANSIFLSLPVYDENIVEKSLSHSFKGLLKYELQRIKYADILYKDGIYIQNFNYDFKNKKQIKSDKLLYLLSKIDGSQLFDISIEEDNVYFKYKNKKYTIDDLNSDPNIAGEIGNYIYKEFAKGFKNYKKQLVSEGVIKEEGKIVYSEIFGDKYKDRKLIDDKSTALDRALFSYYMHYNAYSGAIIQLFTGGLEFYKGWNDTIKRNKFNTTPKTILSTIGIETSINNTICSDIIEPMSNYDQFISALKSVDPDINENDFADYKNNNLVDGSVFISVERARRILEQSGKWNKKYNDVYDKLVKGEEVSEKELVDSGLKFSPRKPIYTFSYKIDTKDGILYVPIMIKCAEFVVSSVNAKDERIKKIYDYLKKTGKDSVSFLSAVKMGASQISLGEKDGKQQYQHNIVSVDNIEDGVPMQLDNEGYGNQQDVPDHYEDTDILMTPQFLKIAVSDFTPDTEFSVGDKLMKKSEVVRLVNLLVATDVRESNEQVSKEIGIDKTGNINDITKLCQLLNRGISSRNLGNSLRPCIEVDPSDASKTKVSSILPTVAHKLQTSIHGYIRRIVDRQRIKGSSFANCPKIYSEDLKTEIDKKNGIIYLDCMLPVWSKEIYKKYGKKDGTIDMDKIQKENPSILKMLGYRTPTEGKFSMCVLRVKGFTTRLSGGVIMLPAEITTRTGLDFDIDKFYVMMKSVDGETDYNTIHGLDLVGDTDNNLYSKLNVISKDKRHNMLIDIISSMLSHPKALPLQSKPGGFKMLKSLRDEILPLTQARSYSHLLDSFTHTEVTYKNMMSLDLRGRLVVDNNTHAVIQNGNLQFRDPKTNFAQFEGQVLYKLGQIYTPEFKTNEGDIKPELISRSKGEAVSAVVDIGNDPVIPDLNISIFTHPVYNILTELGVPLKHVVYFINQPVISHLETIVRKTSDNIDINTIDKATQEVLSDMKRHQIDIDNTDANITIMELKKGIKEDIYTQFQHKVLREFNKFVKMEKDFKMISMSLATEKGPGQTIAENDVKLSSVKRILSPGFSISGVEKFFANTTNNAAIQSFYHRQYGIKFATDISSVFLPYGKGSISYIKEEIDDDISRSRSFVPMSLKKHIEESVVAYYQSQYTLFNIPLSARDKMVKEFPKEYSKFRLKYKNQYEVIDKITSGSTLGFENGKRVSKETMDKMSSELADMLISENEEVRRMAVKLLQYCYITSAFQFKPNSYSVLVVADVIQNLKDSQGNSYNEFLHNLHTKLTTAGSLTDLDNKFIRQFYENNVRGKFGNLLAPEFDGQYTRNGNKITITDNTQYNAGRYCIKIKNKNDFEYFIKNNDSDSEVLIYSKFEPTKSKASYHTYSAGLDELFIDNSSVDKDIPGDTGVVTDRDDNKDNVPVQKKVSDIKTTPFGIATEEGITDKSIKMAKGLKETNYAKLQQHVHKFYPIGKKIRFIDANGEINEGRINSILHDKNGKYTGFEINNQIIVFNNVIEEEGITSKPAETTSDIYNKLGNKTKLENIVIKPWSVLKDATDAITEQGIISTRIRNSQQHFGNPFTHDDRIAKQNKELIKVNSIEEAVKEYIAWIINSQDNRAQWIREQIQSGKLKNKPIFYYTELKEPSHATALDYLINKYTWDIKGTIETEDLKTQKSKLLTGKFEPSEKLKQMLEDNNVSLREFEKQNNKEIEENCNKFGKQ